MKYALVPTFPTTNNEAEHEALIACLMITKSAGVRVLHVKVRLLVGGLLDFGISGS